MTQPWSHPFLQGLGARWGDKQDPQEQEWTWWRCGLRKDSCRQESCGAEKGLGSESHSPQPQAWCSLRSGLTSQGLRLLCKMWGGYGVATISCPVPLLWGEAT